MRSGYSEHSGDSHWSWSPLVIVDDEDNNLFKLLVTSGVNWSWRLKMKKIMI